MILITTQGGNELIKIVKIKYGNVYIYKESGNLYVKDKTGESRKIQYGLYGTEQCPVGLRDYMNIRGISLIEAANELTELGVVLITANFNICFYEEADVERFIKRIEVRAD